MNNVNAEVYQIINDKFDRNLFFNKYDESNGIVLRNIEQQIKKFEEEHPQIILNILQQLKKNFPLARIENWTHFFNHDRCAKFLIQISEELRFICQVSIFNFFSVYQHSAHKIEGKYKYGELTFINKKESTIADIIYNCLGENAKQFIWLDKAILNEVVEHFSILDDDPLFRFEIKVADIIFTDHYL